MSDCPLMNLTDDCLIEVFTHLTNIRDKLRQESVCKIFNRLAKKPSAWRGSETLQIKIDVDDWINLFDEHGSCFVNRTEVGFEPTYDHFSEALHAILKRTNIHHLSFDFTESSVLQHCGRGIQLFDAQVAKMLDIMLSYEDKIKLLTFEYTGNMTDTRRLFMPLTYSQTSLKQLKFSSRDELAYSADDEFAAWYFEELQENKMNRRTCYPEFWDFVSGCVALETLIFDPDTDFELAANTIVPDALSHKPLQELGLYFGEIPEEHLAQICNTATGSGISHLTTQGITNFATFITQLSKDACSALLELKIEGYSCDLQSVIQILPRIRDILPHFRWISVEVDFVEGTAVTADVAVNSITGYFDGKRSGSSADLEHRFAFGPLLLTGTDEAAFRQQLTTRCQATGIAITYGTNFIGRRWTVLERGNGSLVIHSVRVIHPPQVEEGEGDGPPVAVPDDIMININALLL